MVDFQVVCCMCGDVGFPDKLFRCNRCLSRFQHSYCSNYYSESAEPIEQCDWCQSEQRSSSKSRHGSSGSRKSSIVVDKHHDQNNMVEKTVTTKNNASGSSSGVPSPRTATRRYKLLKDVMC